MPRYKLDPSYDPINVAIDQCLEQIKDSFTIEIEQIVGKPAEEIGEADINDIVGFVAGQNRDSDFIFIVGSLAGLSNLKNEHERI